MGQKMSPKGIKDSLKQSKTTESTTHFSTKSSPEKGIPDKGELSKYSAQLPLSM
jgi:hypothetical protein